MTNPESFLDPFEARPKDSAFWSQLRVVLFAAAAVVALIVVNGKPAPAAAGATAAAAAQAQQPLDSSVDSSAPIAAK
ncbi:MAG TPA: hypothetical protein VFR86_22960 [Burkholderiaceae bacterium]|nr:hypothetical protein [Burkholderiaceae bacterium]